MMIESVWPWRSLLLGAFLFVVAAAQVLHYLTVPGDGLVVNTVDGRVEVVEVEPESPVEAAGLRPGDRILEIGDLSPRGGTTQALRVFADSVGLRYRTGETVVFRVERDGTQIDFPVRLDGLSRSDLATQLILFGSLWGVACFLLWAKRAEKHVETIAITIFVVTVGQLLRREPPDIRTASGLLIHQTGLLCRALGPVLMLYFGTVFPVPTVSARTRRALLGFTLLLVGSLLAFEEFRLVAALQERQLSYVQALEGGVGTAYWWLRYWIAAGGVLGFAALLLRAYTRPLQQRARDQIKWLLWGVGTAGAVDALVMSVVMLRLGGYPEALSAYRNLLYLLIPIGLGFSIFRHDLFDVDALIRRSAIYFGTTVALFILFTGSESVLSEALGGFFTMMSGTARSVVSGIVAAMVFIPVRAALERVFRPRMQDTSGPPTDAGSPQLP